MLENPEIANHLVLESIKEGLILFWLLYEPRAVRITPPLTISTAEIKNLYNSSRAGFPRDARDLQLFLQLNGTAGSTAVELVGGTNGQLNGYSAAELEAGSIDPNRAWQTP